MIPCIIHDLCLLSWCGITRLNILDWMNRRMNSCQFDFFLGYNIIDVVCMYVDGWVGRGSTEARKPSDQLVSAFLSIDRQPAAIQRGGQSVGHH